MYPYDLLFVEDEKAIRDTYVEYLKMHFNNVYEAENGEQAYEIYKHKKPQILIVDINLPKLNGIDLLKRIREKDQTTKAIMLTAYTDSNLLIDAASLKLTKYLVKPISRAELNDTINLIIEELKNFNTLSLNKVELKNNYIWDDISQELRCGYELIHLTKKEKKLLVLFVSSINKVFTYNEIINEIWFDIYEGNYDSLKALIKNLRKKLPKDTIKNIFGTGYKMEI